MKNLSFVFMIIALALTGCISRDQADAKLARGCAAGAEIFLTDGYKIKEIKQSTFADSTELGKDYRVVNVQAVVTDGWAEADKEIKCIFSENLAPFGLSYSSQIYQLKMDDQTWGKEGTQILGTMEDQMKLNETVDKAMNKP